MIGSPTTVWTIISDLMAAHAGNVQLDQVLSVPILLPFHTNTLPHYISPHRVDPLLPAPSPVQLALSFLTPISLSSGL